MNNVVMQQDNARFTLFLNGELAAPRAGKEVVWERYDFQTLTVVQREFAGVLETVTESEAGSDLMYECDCKSYLRWFDRRLVSGFFQQQAAETTIKQVISTYCPGFTSTNVKASPVVIPQYANYQRPSNFIKLVCDQIGYGFYIDYDRDVHVYKWEEFDSPLASNLLNVDTNYVDYGDLLITEDAEQVYNRFTIRGFKRRSDSTYTLRFKGDGENKQFQLGYRISSAKGDITVTIGGVPYTVKRDVLEGVPGQAGEAGVAYVHYTQHLVRFATAPASGAIIEVTFYFLTDRTEVDQDDISVDYMDTLENSAATDGIYEYAESNKSLTGSTMEAVRSHIAMLALRHGYPQFTGTFTSFTSGWKSGQSLKLYSTRRFGNAFNPSKRVYIHRVSKKLIQPARESAIPTVFRPIQYTIEFSDKPYLV